METSVDRLERRGRQEGIAIGERRGRNKGKIEGKLEGKLERNRTIARKMRQDAFPVETIMKYTDLTEEEILSL